MGCEIVSFPPLPPVHAPAGMAFPVRRARRLLATRWRLARRSQFLHICSSPSPPAPLQEVAWRCRTLSMAGLQIPRRHTLQTALWASLTPSPPVIAGVSNWPKGGRALVFLSHVARWSSIAHNPGTRVLFDLTGKIGEMTLSKGGGAPLQKIR